MKLNLFLDDYRDPDDVYKYIDNFDYISKIWVVVKNYNEFIKHIKTFGLPEIISFDHDLAPEHYVSLVEHEIPYSRFKEKTGYDCVIWLCEYCLKHNKKLPEYLFHTQNRIGLMNMYKYINKFKL